MEGRLPPGGRERERRARRLLEAILIALVLLRASAGLFRSIRGPTGPHPAPPPLRIDVSRDPEPLLLLLPGIGPGRAAAIERDRRSLGPIERLDQLERIPGVGPATLDRILRARGLDPVASGR